MSEEKILRRFEAALARYERKRTGKSYAKARFEDVSANAAWRLGYLAECLHFRDGHAYTYRFAPSDAARALFDVESLGTMSL